MNGIHREDGQWYVDVEDAVFAENTARFAIVRGALEIDRATLSSASGREAIKRMADRAQKLWDEFKVVIAPYEPKYDMEGTDDALVRRSECEYDLQDKACWVSVRNLSVRILQDDEGVRVNVYPLGREDHDELEEVVVYFGEAFRRGQKVRAVMIIRAEGDPNQVYAEPGDIGTVVRASGIGGGVHVDFTLHKNVQVRLEEIELE